MVVLEKSKVQTKYPMYAPIVAVDLMELTKTVLLRLTHALFKTLLLVTMK